jgi:hypothetical protein
LFEIDRNQTNTEYIMDEHHGDESDKEGKPFYDIEGMIPEEVISDLPEPIENETQQDQGA